MLAVGFIGTSMISHEFAKALSLTEGYKLKAVYSRVLSKAEDFGKAYGVDMFFDDLEAFMASPELDVIYIASPNSLHFDQAMLAMANKKHVIVEKPAFSNLKEWDAANKAADENGVLLFEAARHLHDPNFHIIKNEITKLEKVDNAILYYGKYSSRYDQVVAGEEPNIFSPRFSGGALMDLGVYTLYAALAWFGEPESATYNARKIATNVDGSGTILFRYPTFDVTMHISKNYNLHAPSEVHSGKQTLILDELTGTTEIILENTGTGETFNLAKKPSAHLMLDEALAFHKEIVHTTEKYEEWRQLSRQVAYWSEKLRKNAGITFTADE
ncbi:Gfo/Idh/MocA family oxidoreductase [Jeotgalibaca porci]|uniref:Gfo/Idh/MocA family oxidoreductase n=1 Tax=Jeotgalibaca porci TaxID=1868793 RepID=A0A6G7WGC6_9LACT|nr:Gfo/Idh/MocA family oxidoreductase [Jeotgalibaca porci]QIK51306.1 Gfo/Idh/MocA family oxidoreductase [Jeotgalibaca porci]